MAGQPGRPIHLADVENWQSIRNHGLLRADTLLRRAGLPDVDVLTRTFRPEGLTLPGGVRLRDQRPAPPAALSRCLDVGISPPDWYGLLNSCVFFWLDPARVARHLTAQKGRDTVVMVFDGAALLARYGQAAFVTPFNIGSAVRRPALRGWRTLVPLESWRTDGWAAEGLPNTPKRPLSVAPAELVIRSDIPDAMDFVVEHYRADGSALP